MMNHKAFAQKMNPYTLLYVEDDADVREHIVEFLKRYFKTIYECDSAEEGLKLYGKYDPDIMLLDINLGGGMSGVDLATKVRNNDKQTRMVISTAYTNKEFMLQAIELELTRYLVKPLTNEDLVKAFEKCWSELEERNSIDLGNGYSYKRKMAAIVKGVDVIALRHKELEILEYFLSHEGEVVRYEWLEESIWGDELMSRDAIRSQIRNLRKKLQVEMIENVSGVGYQFNRKRRV